MFPVVVFGQWSSDPSNNFIVTEDSASLYLNSRLIPYLTHKDELYIGWISSSNDACIHLFDEHGFAKWDTPIVGNNWWSKLNVDNEGDAILSYSVSKGGYFNELQFMKINRNGEVLWKEDEIGLSQESVPTYVYRHNIRISPENAVLTSYFNSFEDGTSISVNKITSDGNLVWQDQLIKRKDVGRTAVFFGDNGGAIFVYRILTDWANHSNIFVCALDVNGQQIWPKDELIYSGYMAQWTLNTYQSANGNCYYAFQPSKLFALNSNGQQIWEQGGVDIINDSTAFTVSPKIVGLTNSHELLLQFVRKNQYQREPQNYGQLIGTNGERLWSNQGRAYTEDSHFLDNSHWRMNNDTVFVVYQTDYINSEVDSSKLFVCIFRYDEYPDWNNSIDITGHPRPITSYQVSNAHNGQIVVAWTEDVLGVKSTLFAQNIRTDGTLGIKSTSIHQIPEPTIQFAGYDSQNKTLRFDGFVNNGRYYLRNIMGKTVSEGEVKEIVNLPSITPGIHILTIFDSQSQYSQKLFIQ